MTLLDWDKFANQERKVDLGFKNIKGMDSMGFFRIAKPQRDPQYGTSWE